MAPHSCWPKPGTVTVASQKKAFSVWHMAAASSALLNLRREDGAARLFRSSGGGIRLKFRRSPDETKRSTVAGSIGEGRAAASAPRSTPHCKSKYKSMSRRKVEQILPEILRPAQFDGGGRRLSSAHALLRVRRSTVLVMVASVFFLA